MIIDVRSPLEFGRGHIPGAVNLPLFSDEERAKVGTLYKQVGQAEAFDLGLKFVGPKLVDFVSFARALSSPLELYCWRGGMRSASMAWLFRSAGMSCTTREGGYKAYRHWVLETLARPRTFKVLTGPTGSGKTERLHALEKEGEATLDLENLANHRGSSFGMLGMPPQPTNEHFENLIASRLEMLKDPIWVENESRMIGTCKVPDPIYAQLQKSEQYCVEATDQERFDRLVRLYGHLPKKDLISATVRLKKKLGNVRTNEIVKLIENNDYFSAAKFLLEYYDLAYDRAFSRQTGH